MDRYLSTIRVPIDKIPEAKNWKVGSKSKILAEIELTGINKERDWSHEDECRPMSIKDSKKMPARYKTMVEFKVFDVSAAKTDALKKKIK